MKSSILAFALLAVATTAYGQAAKPGATGPIALQATLVTESAPVLQALPNGGTKKTYAVTSVRYTNREVLDAMRLAALLDGTISGWTLARFTDANDVGNLYAVKSGKTAVAVPTTLLTQPVVQGHADSGTLTKSTANSPELPNLSRRAYVSLTVKGGACTSAGLQNLGAAGLKTGATTTPVITHTESFDIAGKGSSGNSIVTGTYKIQRSVPVNLAPFFPGNAVP